MDHLGPFKKSSKGKSYLLVAVEQVSKWVETKAIQSESAEQSARFLSSRLSVDFVRPVTWEAIEVQDIVQT